MQSPICNLLCNKAQFLTISFVNLSPNNGLPQGIFTAFTNLSPFNFICEVYRPQMLNTRLIGAYSEFNYLS